MKLEKYETYKDSGVEWLGEIPTHWDVKRVKDLAYYQSGEFVNASDFEDEGLFPVYGGNGLRGFINQYNHNGKYILIGRQGALCGNINYAHGKFWATEHAVVVYKKKNINTQWLGELLRVMNLNQYALSAAQPGLSVDKIKRLGLPFVSVEEQTAIAHYLDTKTTAIDKKVALLESKINRYQELRKSLINETVCRGLDKSVQLKASGIEWIGEVPEHWTLKRIKDIVIINALALPESTSEDYTFKYIDIGNVNQNGIIEEPESIEFGGSPSRARRIVKQNDVIVSTVRTYLKAVAFFDDFIKDVIVSTGFAVLSHKKNIHPKFLAYLVQSEIFIDSVVKNSTGVSYPAINTSTIASLSLFAPNESEQTTIATYLDTQTQKIDSITMNLKGQIEKLKELRKTLINDVVTGKIKVTT